MTRTRAQRRTPPGPARAPLHVESRPFAGAARPVAAPDLAVVAADALDEARGALATAHAPGCRCSAWCRDDWTYAPHGAPALGPCSLCGELCRSVDPEDRLRHPTCVPETADVR